LGKEGGGVTAEQGRRPGSMENWVSAGADVS